MKTKGPRPLTDEEKEAKAVAKEAAAEKKRWQLIVTISRQHVVNSLTHGVWNSREGKVVFVSPDREDAAAEMEQLKTGKP